MDSLMLFKFTMRLMKFTHDAREMFELEPLTEMAGACFLDPSCVNVAVCCGSLCKALIDFGCTLLWDDVGVDMLNLIAFF